MSDLIDNKNKFLGDSIEEIIPSVDNIDIFVGYFYFSGFKELYKQLESKKIRILVGKEINQEILKRIKNLETLKDPPEDPDGTLNPNRSKTSIRKKYIDTFAKVFNDSDLFDKDEEVEAFKLFMNKLKDGSMEIKKTIASEHGKFYLLYKDLDNEEYFGISIMGSSNFTYNGLKGQGELNKLSEEKKDLDQYKKIFEEQWSDENSISISTLDTYDEFEKDIKEKLWLFSLPDPYLLYIKVLNEYFSTKEEYDLISPAKITKGEFLDLKYQQDAIRLGIDRINQYNGVIIADVVGLGKSIIAAAIAHNLKLKTVVIAPPHLVDQWIDYCEQFDITARVFSSGRIEEVFERYGKSDEKRLFILDEAHKYRNEETQDYLLLHKLCQSNKVIVLSATPFNNDPKDIFALVKLFDVPGRSKLKTVENLSMQFRELIKQYKQIRTDMKKADSNKSELDERTEEIAQELRRIIEPLVIRRSRRDLDQIDEYREDLIRQNIEFPDVQDPELLTYDLGEISNLYIETLEKIHSLNKEDDVNSFQGVRYQPAKYLSPETKKDFYEELKNNENYSDDDVESLEQAQVNVAKFMRTLLVRRFESSIYSFRKTLDAMIESHHLVRGWYEKLDVVPIYKKGSLPDVESFNDLFSDEVEDELKEVQMNEELSQYQKRGLILIPRKYLTSEFIVKLDRDIKLLEGLKKQWNESLPDPKFDYFKSQLDEFLRDNPNRKIVVFSEFSDTVDYVSSKLKNDHSLKVFQFSSKDSNKKNRDIIRDNFDAGVVSSKQDNSYDILVATDAISEGFNLHRAGAIYNYDIPYNPTRVIQRIGRINRINKKVYDKLYIFNFFPTPTGEIETNTKKISQLKMNLIHSLLGEDTKILSIDEDLRNYFAKQYNEEQDKNDQASWENQHRNEWNRIKNDQELLDQIAKIPHRTRIMRENFSVKGVIVFGKKGENIVFGFSSDGKLSLINDEKALSIFQATKDESSEEVSGDFQDLYFEVKELLFKNNTAVMVAGRRRQDALNIVRFLKEKIPQAKEYFDDLTTIIKEFDGLPDGVLKEINKLDLKNPDQSFSQLMKFVSKDYIESIFENAESSKDDQELIVLSEELS